MTWKGTHTHTHTPVFWLSFSWSDPKADALRLDSRLINESAPKLRSGGIEVWPAGEQCTPSFTVADVASLTRLVVATLGSFVICQRRPGPHSTLYSFRRTAARIYYSPPEKRPKSAFSFVVFSLFSPSTALFFLLCVQRSVSATRPTQHMRLIYQFLSAAFASKPSTRLITSLSHRRTSQSHSEKTGSSYM